MVRININVTGGPDGAIHLKSGEILKYFLAQDKGLEELIILNPEEKKVVTTDKDLYEAVGSVQKEDNFKLSRLTKLLEVVDVYPYKGASKKEKPILTFERLDKLRAYALGKTDKQTNMEDR